MSKKYSSIYYKHLDANDPRYRFIGNVDRDYHNLLTRQIRLQQSDNFNFHLKSILYQGGWITIPAVISNIPDYLEGLSLYCDSDPINIIYSKIVNSRVPSNILNDIIQARRFKQKEFIDLYIHLISHNGIFDLSEVLGKGISTIIGRDVSEYVTRLVDVLWNIKFTLAGNNIGCGEVCLTILTGAMKADVGDLKLPDNSREVEMKCTKGKLGSKYYADYAPTRLSKVLGIDYNEFQRRSIFAIERTRNTDTLLKLQQEMRDRRDLIRSKLKIAECKLLNDIFERDSKNKQPTKAQSKARQAIIESKRFVHDVGVYEVPVNCSGTGTSKQQLQGLKNIYNQINQREQFSYDTFKCPRDRKFIFAQAVKDFFLSNRLSAVQCIDGVFECRNNKLTSHEQYELKNSIYNFFFSRPLTLLKDKETLGRIMITLHTICYWMEHKFTEIHIINDKTKSCLFIHLPSSDFSLENVFEFIYNQIPVELKTTLGIGGQSPTGVEIYLSV